MTLASLQDLFLRQRERATGLWKLGQEPSRTVYFDSGDIVFAHSTHPKDRLTSLLVERGKLTQAQMDYALANLKPGFSIGRNLIEMGFITQRDLLEVARAQVERVVWGAMGAQETAPQFSPQELDAAVVRLPMDTPRLLLEGLLKLQDREQILEVLGPLNQVVVLQGRRLTEMELPTDLAKLPPMLDGTRTLLELGHEVSVEPLRLGAFALFLREMGWAKLHELPPLDRQALDLALAPEPEPIAQPMPQPLEPPTAALFSTIVDAARPTTNLEHLSSALDELLPEPDFPAAPEPEPSLEPEWPEPPESPAFEIQEGQAYLPTPQFELPPLPEEESPLALREPTLQGPALETDLGDSEPVDQEKRRSPFLLPLVLLLLVVLGVAGTRWVRRHRRPKRPNPAPPVLTPLPPQPPAPVQSPTEMAAPSEPSPASPELRTSPAVPERAAPRAPRAVPAPSPASPTPSERLAAINRGDLVQAVALSEQAYKNAPPASWTLRLEIACLDGTVQNAIKVLKDKESDLFILPITLKDGRTCYQVCLGIHATQAQALATIQHLPQAFRVEGNRPRPYRISDLPRRQ